MEEPTKRIWTKYVLERLQSEGIPVEQDLTLGPEDDPYALSIYIAKTPHIELHASIWFEPSKLSHASGLEDLVQEEIDICPGDQLVDQGKELYLSFDLHNEEARLKDVDTHNLPHMTFPYVAGIDYDAKTVVDELIKAFVAQYHGVPRR